MFIEEKKIAIKIDFNNFLNVKFWTYNKQNNRLYTRDCE